MSTREEARSSNALDLPGVLSDPFDPLLVLHSIETACHHKEEDSAPKASSSQSTPPTINHNIRDNGSEGIGSGTLDWEWVKQQQWKRYPIRYKSVVVEDGFLCFYFLRYQRLYVLMGFMVFVSNLAPWLSDEDWTESVAGWIRTSVLYTISTTIAYLLWGLWSKATRLENTVKLEKLRYGVSAQRHDDAHGGGKPGGSELIAIEVEVHEMRVKRARVAEIYFAIFVILASVNTGVNHYRTQDTDCTTTTLRCGQHLPVGLVGAMFSIACMGPRPHLSILFSLGGGLGLVYGYLSTSAEFRGNNQGTHSVTAVIFIFVVVSSFALRVVRDKLYRQMYESQLKLAAEKELVQQRKEQVNQILETMLPPTILPKLLRHEIPDTQQPSSVLISDIVGFTSWCSTRSALQVVEMLQIVINDFDVLALEAGVIRIKTMGDGYLAACGIPVPVDDHADRLVWFAIKMHAALAARCGGSTNEWGPIMMRIGLHTGETIGTMISMQRWAYDVLGPIPDWAGVLEQNCATGNVLMSAAVRDALSPRWKETPATSGELIIPSTVALSPGKVDLQANRKERLGASNPQLFEFTSVAEAAALFPTLPKSTQTASSGNAWPLAPEEIQGSAGSNLTRAASETRRTEALQGILGPKPGGMNILEGIGSHQESLVVSILSRSEGGGSIGPSRGSRSHSRASIPELRSTGRRIPSIPFEMVETVAINHMVEASAVDPVTTKSQENVTGVVTLAPKESGVTGISLKEEERAELGMESVLQLKGVIVMNFLGSVSLVALAVSLLVLNLVERGPSHSAWDVGMKAALVAVSLVAFVVPREHRWKVSVGAIFLFGIPIVVTDTLAAVNPVPSRIAVFLFTPLWIFVIPSMPFAITLASTWALWGIGHLMSPGLSFGSFQGALVSVAIILFRYATIVNLEEYLRTRQSLERVLLEAHDEVASLSGLLKLKMPEHVIDQLLQRLTQSRQGAVMQEFSSAVVGFIRFDSASLAALLENVPTPDSDASTPPVVTSLTPDATSLIATQRAASKWVDDIFSGSDLLDKVKTMGDTFMVAGPIRPRSADKPPERYSADSEGTQAAALDMIRLLKELHDDLQAYAKDGVSVCVGVAVGPMIAAVIGTSQLEFDVFGATVNLASRIMNSIPTPPPLETNAPPPPAPPVSSTPDTSLSVAAKAAEALSSPMSEQEVEEESSRRLSPKTAEVQNTTSVDSQIKVSDGMNTASSTFRVSADFAALIPLKFSSWPKGKGDERHKEEEEQEPHTMITMPTGGNGVESTSYSKKKESGVKELRMLNGELIPILVSKPFTLDLKGVSKETVAHDLNFGVVKCKMSI